MKIYAIVTLSIAELKLPSPARTKISSHFPGIETKTSSVTSDCRTFLLKLMLSEQKVLMSERSDIKMPAREKAKLMMRCHEKRVEAMEKDKLRCIYSS